jgi:chromosome segregation ATPase
MADVKQELAELRREMNERFDQMNERFDRMNERFDQMNERFDQIYDRMLVVTRWTVGGHSPLRCRDHHSPRHRAVHAIRSV